MTKDEGENDDEQRSLVASLARDDNERQGKQRSGYEGLVEEAAAAGCMITERAPLQTS